MIFKVFLEKSDKKTSEGDIVRTIKRWERKFNNAYASFYKKIPAPIRNFFISQINRIKRFSDKCINKITSFIFWPINKIQKLQKAWAKRKEIKEKKQTSQAETIHKTGVAKFEGAKDGRLKTQLQRILSFLAILISMQFNKVSSFFWKITAEQIAIFATASAVFVTAGVVIYKSSESIIEQTAKREIASVQLVYKDKPAYFKGERKQILMPQIKLPIYLSQQQSIRFLSMDVILHSDNRYIIKFLEHNEPLVRDRIVLSTENIEANFPLEQEGKTIIKEKIQDELSKLLKERHVKGKIINISLHDILGV